MKKRFGAGIFAGLGVAVLIFDAQTALHAAQDAVQLCLRVIIPSLFPFFVLINLLSNAMLGSRFPGLRLLEKLLHLPAGSGSLFIAGLLGGYPTGAKMLHHTWKAGVLDRTNAQRMLSFCSNAGPAFIFGIIGPMFADKRIPWLIWAIHIISAVLVGSIYARNNSGATAVLQSGHISVSDAVQKSISVIGYVCGWVVLFRILAVFCRKWFIWLLPNELQVLFISVMELSNGCTMLDLVENEGLRMILASAAVNFGGICVLMQTSSVIGALKIGDYWKGKLLQTAFATGLAVAVQYFLLPSNNRINLSYFRGLVFLAVIFAIFLVGRKITVAFRREMLYNAVKSKGKG